MKTRLAVLLILLITVGSNAQPGFSSFDLIKDNHFQNGLTILAPEHGKKIPQGTISSDTTAEIKPVWQLAQWNSRFSIKDAKPVKSTDGSVCYSNIAKSITIAPPGSQTSDIILMVDSRPEYDSKLRTRGQPWTHLLVEQKITNSPAVSDIKQLSFHIEARLLESQTFKPEGYTTSLHCAQIPFVLTIQNLNRQSRGYGDFIWFSIPIYDDRYQIPPEYIAQDFADPSSKLIYNPGAAVFTSESLHGKKWVIINVDLLPFIHKALNTAWEKGYLKDSKDLSDYRISSTNLGWEVTGLNKVAIQIRNLNLKAALKAKPDHF